MLLKKVARFFVARFPEALESLNNDGDSIENGKKKIKSRIGSDNKTNNFYNFARASSAFVNYESN